TADGSLSAHFEHTVAVTATGPRILTAPPFLLRYAPAPQPPLCRGFSCVPDDSDRVSPDAVPVRKDGGQGREGRSRRRRRRSFAEHDVPGAGGRPPSGARDHLREDAQELHPH